MKLNFFDFETFDPEEYEHYEVYNNFFAIYYFLSFISNWNANAMNCYLHQY